MENPNIGKLYKYRAFNEYALDMIQKEFFWVPTPDTFNDPFDCNLDPGLQKTTKDLQFQLNQVIDEIYDPIKSKQIKLEISERNQNKSIRVIQDGSIKKHLDESKKNGVFSLSEKPDQILMWSHYANNHTGFCIEFERADEPDNYLSHFMCQPVKYSSTYPNLNKVVHLWEINLYTKALEWSYEAEWRLVLNKGNFNIPSPAPITGIIMGLKMKNEHKEIIKKAIKQKPHITLYQASRKKGKFALELLELKTHN